MKKIKNKLPISTTAQIELEVLKVKSLQKAIGLRRVWNSNARSLIGTDDCVELRFSKGGGKSMTVPDASYSIKELFARHQAGLTVPGHEGVYSDVDIPMIERMDFADRSQFLEDIKEHRQFIEKEFKKLDHLDKERIKREDLEKQEANDSRLKDIIRKEREDAG